MTAFPTQIDSGAQAIDTPGVNDAPTVTITAPGGTFQAVGGEILVNTAVASFQHNAQITALSNGGFVVTWADASQGVGGAAGDNSSWAVKAQVFAAGGAPVGGEILVNTAVASFQDSPQITALSNGGFVVTWQDASHSIGGAGGDNDSFAVKAQVFAAGGAPVGGEILVNTAVASSQAAPQITALSNGGFVVTWADASQGVGGAAGDNSSWAVKAQVFAAGGAPVDGEILVNAATAGEQNNSQITALSNGGFVVTWIDNSEGVGGAGGDNSGTAVKAQVFAAGGAPVGGEILVNTAIVNGQTAPQITALSNGGFVVTWQDQSLGFGGATGDDSSFAVKVQVFAADGAPVGGEILVNTAVANDQAVPQITALSNGGFVVTWIDVSQSAGGATGDNSLSAVKAQVFTAGGAPVGGEILVNTAVESDQSEAQITPLPNGGFVVTWSDFSQGVGGATGDNSQFAVKAQVFAAGGAPVGSEILVNTAVAGGQYASQITALSSGAFVVTWTDFSQGVGGATGDNSGSAVKAQVFGPVPVDFEATEQTPLDLKSTIAVADADAGAGVIEVILSVDYGVLDVTAGTSGALVAGSGTDSVTITGTLAEIQALLASDATSIVTFTANSDAPPASAELTVQVDDGGNSGSGGALTGSDSITITVNAVNDAPSGADKTLTGSEDDALVLAATDFGFSDPIDGNGFAGVVISTLPTQGQLRLNGGPLKAGQFISIIDINTGDFTFQPNPNESGATYASFNFRVVDNGGTANGGVDTDQSANTITIDITADNGPPLAVGDEYKFVEDTILTVGPQGVLGNDTDPDFNPLTAILVSGPSHAAAFTFNPDGSFSYTPDADFTGVDSFTYRANDGEFDSNVATVRLQVSPVNDAPVGGNESYNVIEDVTLAIAAPGVLNNDVDVDGDALTAVLVTGPAHAAAFTLNADGSFSYTPANDYVGADSFSYRPYDGVAFGNVVTVSFDVIAADDAAAARNDDFSILENALLLGSVFVDNGSGPDSDPDSPLAVASVNGAAANVGQTIVLASGALLTLNADGTFAYDPNGQFDTLTIAATGADNLNALDSFTYGLAGGGTATVLVTIDGLRTVTDHLIGSAGNDVITDAGFNYNDSFFLQQGGNDSATGLGGNDGFYFGAELGTLDNVDGGAGTDSLALQGNYAALVLGNIVNVENLVPLAGNNTAFGDLAGNLYDYNITTNDANVAAGATLTVIGGNLRAGEDLIFNGSAETDGKFRIFAGQGEDTLSSGAGNDGFFFGADANLNGLDIVNGGLGTDSIALRGNYVGATAINLQPTSMAGIEVIAFLSGHTNEFGGVINLAGFDYDVRTADANVAAGVRLEVAAGNLRANESLTFNGQAETNGSFRIISGAGDDVLTGGDGADIIYGALGADVLQGNGGADTYIYRFATESTTAARDRINWGAGDKIDLSLVDANASTGANEAFTFIGAGAFTGVAGQLRVTNAAGNGLIEGDVNGDGVADLTIFVDSYVPVVGDFVL